MKSFLNSISEMINPLINENANAFFIENNAQANKLFTDMQKLRQILLNLLSNAAKFTLNGTITLTIDSFTRSNVEFLSFVVADTGVGICEEAQKYIFDEFTQDLSNTIALHNGTGLGLNICRTFSQLLGGSILVSSQKGHGSKFSVVIPAELSVEDNNPQRINQQF